ncbi:MULTISPECIES: N-acetylglucosamine-6-phosphate deacetylase [unclassified Ornithinimicrobium]|uniref:N-acetylglucosamine-6-phosphate deacetylase n=1 Tax=unclassified Ornithinimicrobium TaxID=2615080 RepID=UPI003854ED63
MIEVRAERMLHADGSLAPGWVQVEGERVVDVCRAAPGGSSSETVPVLSPGFVDIHGHGGGGFSYDDPEPDHVLTALAAHRRHGTTTAVASLVTHSGEVLHTQVRRLAELVRAGELAGVHLEGPCLSPEHRGAHAQRWLTGPRDLDLVALAEPGVVRMVTLAPELPDALETVARLVARGLVVAVGHTAADADTTRRAFDAGARVVTHLFNAMPPMHHRAPGPVPVALNDPRVVVELVADGHHVAPEVLLLACRAAPGRVALVTDAMAGAAAADGDYPLGELTSTVRDGVARIGADGPIAGSTLTMDQAVRTLVGAGCDPAEALRSATATPARALGLGGVGVLEPGALADLVVLDDDLSVVRVMRRGRWLPDPSPGGG